MKLISEINNSGIFAQSAISASISTKDSLGRDITATYLTEHQTIPSAKWEDTSDLVQSNSAKWNEIEEYETNSASYLTAHQDISDKLDTTAFSTVSGTFLTAHQDLSNYATTGDLDTASSFLSGAIDYVSANAGSTYSGVDPIVVDNENKIISANTTPLTVGSGLQYDNGELCVSGLEISGINLSVYEQDNKIVLSAGATFTQEQANWTELDSSSPSYIQNKPNTMNLMAGPGIGIYENNNDYYISANEGTTYSGIAPIYVNNTTNEISADTEDITFGSGLDLTNGVLSVTAQGGDPEVESVVKTNSADWGTITALSSTSSLLNNQVTALRHDLNTVSTNTGYLYNDLQTTSGILSGAIDYVSANAGLTGDYISGSNVTGFSLQNHLGEPYNQEHAIHFTTDAIAGMYLSEYDSASSHQLYLDPEKLMFVENYGTPDQRNETFDANDISALKNTSGNWNDISAYQANSGNYYPMTGNPSGFMTNMFLAHYGTSTYQEVKDAVDNGKIVYCQISPTGASRMAFLAYIGSNNYEFQYYRSLNQHTSANQGDEVYVYTCNKTGTTWTTTTRNCYTRISATSGLDVSYSNGTYYISNPHTATPNIVYQTSSVTIPSGVWEAGQTFNTNLFVGAGKKFTGTLFLKSLACNAPNFSVETPGHVYFIDNGGDYVAYRTNHHMWPVYVDNTTGATPYEVWFTLYGDFPGSTTTTYLDGIEM